MNFIASTNSFVVISILTFVTVLLLLEGMYLLWNARKGPEATRLKQRLKALAASSDHTTQAQVLKQGMLGELSAFERALQQMPRLHARDRAILQSGLQWTVSGVLIASTSLLVFGWILTAEGAHLSPLICLAVAGSAACLPVAYVMHRRGKRLATIGRPLPDTLDLMTRALRAGHAFTAALKMAGEETSEPIAGEFRTVHDQINFGVSMQQALANLSERVPSTDVRYFVVAVLIQRESGGNLTEILSNLSNLIRQRAKLLAKIKVLSSEGRMSAWILGVMPFALAAAMHAVNPKFMSLLWTDPIGQTLIEYMLTLMAIGALVMRKIVRIRV